MGDVTTLLTLQTRRVMNLVLAEPAEAEAPVRETLARARALGVRSQEPDLLAALGFLHHRRGDLAQARASYAMVRHLATVVGRVAALRAAKALEALAAAELGEPWDEADLPGLEACAALWSGRSDLAEARRQLRANTGTSAVDQWVHVIVDRALWARSTWQVSHDAKRVVRPDGKAISLGRRRAGRALLLALMSTRPTGCRRSAGAAPRAASSANTIVATAWKGAGTSARPLTT